MQKICKCISLDLHEAESRQIVNVKEDDTGRKIIINLNQSGRPYFVDDDCRAVVAGTRPDGFVFLNDATIENGRVLYTITELNTAAAGVVNTELRLYGPDGELIATPSFSIKVMESAVDDGEVLEGAEATALTQLIREADEAIDTMKASTITGAEVSVDNSVGEPSASVELILGEDGQTLKLDFANLKGDKGETGDTGLSIFVADIIADDQVAAVRYEYIHNSGRNIQIGDFLLTSVTGRVYRVVQLTEEYAIGTYTETTLIGPQGDVGPAGKDGAPGKDGANGKDGAPGAAGADGFSPTIDVSKSGKTTTLTITDKNGVKTAEILDGADGTGGGGADILNENGIIKQQHLPENYPYKEVGGGYILPETELVYDENVSTFALMSGLDASMFTDGKLYTVSYNGAKYETQATYFSKDGISAIILGNSGRITGAPETGENFTLFVFDTASQAIVGLAAYINVGDAPESVTLSIFGKTENITKIGMEYLPDGYPCDGEPRLIITQEMISNATEAVECEYGVYKKVSDTAYTIERLLGGCLIYGDNDIAGMSYSDKGNAIEVGGGDAYSVFSDFEIEPGAVLTPGFWAFDYSRFDDTLEIQLPATLKPIAKKYLPAGYPYAEPTVFLPETTPVFSADMGGFIIMSGLDADMFIVGQSYTVNWNGTEYVSQAAVQDDGSMKAIILGDLGAMQGAPTTGEPFVIMIMDAAAQAAMGIAAMVIPIDGSMSITLSISGETVTPIDTKFLPGGRVVIIKRVDNGAPSMTYADALAALKNGALLVFRDCTTSIGLIYDYSFTSVAENELVTNPYLTFTLVEANDISHIAISKILMYSDGTIENVTVN